MKLKHLPPLRPSLQSLVLGVAATTLASYVAHAMPYATSLTNNAGVVSFRLNQTTATNDTVVVISGGGTVTNVLQTPGASLANTITRGLIVTNLGIGAGPIQVQIAHIGSGQIATNSPIVPFGTPRGVTVNRNPSSPYFGWVYVANAATNTNNKGDGIFAFGADLSDALGQGNAPKTGGYTGFGSSTSYSPYRISVAPDDSVLVCDTSDTTGNLISMDPLLGSFQYVLKQLNTKSAAAPVGSNNVHGSVSSAVIVGTGSSRVLYTMDEDYQTDPASTLNTEWNSVWRYDIGAGPLPWANAPTRKMMTPYILSFAGQNQELTTGPSGYLYVIQRRSNGGQYGLYIVDPNNPIDPSTYAGKQGGYMWNSQDESLAEGWSDDLLRECNGVTVSSDGKFLACIIAQAAPVNNNNTLGISVTNQANDLVILPLTNGIPNLAKRTVFRGLGLASLGRGLAFDAANNLYAVSSGQALLQSVDLGQSGATTTDSSGSFTFETPASEISVQATVPLAYEQGSTPGVFTLTRTAADVSRPLTVSYTLSGTATNGVDFATVASQATFASGATTTTINVTPVDDNIPEMTESVVLKLTGGAVYTVGTPASAEIDIVDNEAPQLQVVSLSTNLFEGNPYDTARVTVRRYGDTNTFLMLDASSFTCSGTAVSNVDYYVTNQTIYLDMGVVDKSFDLIYPIDNSVVDGSRSITLGLLAGYGYTAATNTATTTLTDDDVPAETVLWSDNFNTDSSANWRLAFASTNGAPEDYSAVFAYDYGANWVPAAPHSGGDTHGLKLTVNKNDNIAVGAALNLYPIGRTFSGNYALRFDMYLVLNSLSYTTEYALFGINHSGNQTNWFRNSTGGVPTGWTFDGLFYGIESDAAALGDYVLYSSPFINNNPTPVVPGRNASTLEQVFKAPPYGFAGALGNQPITATPSWAQVEVSHINNIVTLKINNTVIFSYNNTNSAYSSGNIMLGYEDAYDSIGNNGAGAGEACVIYDNVRVVRLSGLQVKGLQTVSGNAVVRFTFDANDSPDAFKVQSATTVNGPYTDATATITQTGAGAYQATTAMSGDVRFYRILHQ